MSAETAGVPGPSGASGRESATYSSSPRATVVMPGAPATGASASRRSAGRVAERTPEPRANATSLSVRAPKRAASASSNTNPRLSVPMISGGAVPMEIGTVTTFRTPSAWVRNEVVSNPASALATGTVSPAAGPPGPTDASTTPSRFVTTKRSDSTRAW